MNKAFLFLIIMIWSMGMTWTVAFAAQFKDTEQSCIDGVPLACRELGFMYSEGREVKQDERKAVRLFKKACDANDVRGCGALGSMYALGKGVEKNNSKAVKLFKLACDSHEAVECFSLGVMYEFGLGVNKDVVKARSLYYTACEREEALGCDNYERLNR